MRLPIVALAGRCLPCDGTIMTQRIRYAFRPRPFAAETVVDLTDRAIEAQRAGKDSTIALRDIVTIRLFYAPRGINFTGFRAKLYTRGGTTLAFEDRSFKGLVEQERLEAAYRAFVSELCSRAEAANPNVLLYGGRAVTILALVGGVGLLTTNLLAYFVLRSVMEGKVLLAAGIAVFVGWFAAWTWAYVMRNRPQSFRAAAIPPQVLPSPDAG